MFYYLSVFLYVGIYTPSEKEKELTILRFGVLEMSHQELERIMPHFNPVALELEQQSIKMIGELM